MPKVSEPQPCFLEINCCQNRCFLEYNTCRARVFQQILSKKHWSDDHFNRKQMDPMPWVHRQLARGVTLQKSMTLSLWAFRFMAPIKRPPSSVNRLVASMEQRSPLRVVAQQRLNAIAEQSLVAQGPAETQHPAFSIQNTWAGAVDNQKWNHFQ